MSSMQYKAGFRVVIERLRSATFQEAFEFFSEKLGQPDEIDEYNNVVSWFKYNGEYQPAKECNGTRNEPNDGWFCDKILFSTTNLRDAQFYLRLNQFDDEIEKLCNLFGVDSEDIMIFSYNWYDGVDEPRIINPKHAH